MKFSPLVFVYAMLSAAPALASFQAHRIAIPARAIVLDGVPDEPAWQAAAAYDTFYEALPEDKIAAKVRTEVRLAYDDKYLYVAIRAWDPDSALLRAPYARRDKVNGEQDYVGIFLDPTGGKTSAQFVYVNPRGALSDGMYTDSNGEDYAPDFDVDAATARFDGGWSTELRFALASLPYTADGKAQWNLLVERNLSRGQRYKNLSAPVPRTSNCMLCFMQPISGIRDLPSGWTWSATPQFAARRGDERTGKGTRRRYSGSDASLDLKVRPNSNTTIDATINPDFSQIELDAPQLSGNTNFGLFLPELRPFFLEGADTLQTQFRAINTRSIADPQWGVRYTRRDAASDITMLSVLDAGGGLVQLPSAYFTGYAPQNFKSRATVLRTSFRFDTLSLGAVAADRTLEGGRGYNRMAGPDLTWQRNNEEKLRAQVLFSSTTAQPDSHGELQRGAATRGHAAVLEWWRDDDIWGYYAYMEDLSDGFRADNGFFSQVGYRDAGGALTYKLGKTGIWHLFNLYAQAQYKTDRDGDVMTEEPRFGLYMQGPYDSTLNLRLKPRSKARVERHGALFETAQVWAYGEISPSRVLARVALEGEYGDAIDVDAARLGRGGFWRTEMLLRPFDSLEAAFSYTASSISGRAGRERGKRLYKEEALQVSAIYHFGPRDTLRAIVQHGRTVRDPAYYSAPVTPRQSQRIASLVYKHANSLGNAIYVGMNLASDSLSPRDPRHKQNEVFVKLSWQP
ncbi:MAG TPA: sugar-binding protein [Burkholderiaceae bacterium]